MVNGTRNILISKAKNLQIKIRLDFRKVELVNAHPDPTDI